jgi:hypothetical protein
MSSDFLLVSTNFSYIRGTPDNPETWQTLGTRNRTKKGQTYVDFIYLVIMLDILIRIVIIEEGQTKQSPKEKDKDKQ